MKDVMKVVVFIALVCVVGVDSNILNFLSMMSEEISELAQNAWDAIKQFVKRPPRYKRLHQGNVDATKDPIGPPYKQDYPIELDDLQCIDMVTTATTIEETTKRFTLPPDVMYYFQRPKHKQVILPVIQIPKWRTRDDWLDMQQPNLGFFFRRGQPLMGANYRDTGMTLFPVTKKNDVDGEAPTAVPLDEVDEEDLGVMMFV